MIVDCISDLHGHFPKLDGGDLLIIAGDLTARDTQNEHIKFLSCINQQDYKKKIWIAGNHDNYLINTKFIPIKDLGLEYLCDSGTEFEYEEKIEEEHKFKGMISYSVKRKLKIWGIPWSLTFPELNPRCAAFTCKESEMQNHVSKIPDDVDILISHGPAYMILDKSIDGRLCGSFALRQALDTRIKPRLMVTGHIHEDYGQALFKHSGPNTICVNPSHVNKRYQPVNKPIRVIL